MQNFALKFQAVAEKTAKNVRGLLYFAAPCSFCCHDQRSVEATRLDPYSEPTRRGQNLALAAQGWSCGEPLSGGWWGSIDEPAADL